MNNAKELRKIIEDLIEVLQAQAKELERTVTHLEQHTTRLQHPHQLPLVVSQLSELHARIKRVEVS